MQMDNLLQLAGADTALQDENTAHLAINLKSVDSKRLVPGLRVDTTELDDGLEVRIVVAENVRIERQVHLCFGVTQKQAVQRIEMSVTLEPGASMSVLSHCVFPYAVDVQHIMNASIHVGQGASYRYEEKHIHSDEGGVAVYPSAEVELAPHARFRTTFELVRGRVGTLDIDYGITAHEQSTADMMSKVSGSGDDSIKINERGDLVGEGARGVLNSRVAVRDNATAEIHNRLRATAAHARGHVDCKEIIKGNGSATAVPVVTVSHPLAHVTHEAAIGSVDTKQLQTLMARGLNEDEATERIIEGLLA